MKDKSSTDAFKGDDFMELKYRMMKKIEVVTAVRIFGRLRGILC